MTTFHTQLEQLGALAIIGPDSDTFLQGQTTCDVDDLSEQQSITGAYCTPQGRMIADFRIVAIAAEQRLLLMDREICANTCSTFGKYIVFSRAELTVASDAWTFFGLWGEAAAQHLGGARTRNASWTADDVVWIQLDDQGQRFLAAVPATNAAALEQWLMSCSEAAAQSQWLLQEIRAGEGHVSAATVDLFIPQMLNYQLTGQVSFTKGCYTGQEVVARMHYRGKIKRPMMLCEIATTATPEAGDILYKAGSDQGIGHVVSAAHDTAATHSSGDKLFTALVVITRDAVEDTVTLGSHDGPRLQFVAQPYPLPESGSGD